ncbi:MAG: TrbI/VirB10 family protein [Vibrionaceae bacterium]
MSENSDFMSPESSPSQISRNFGGRRANDRPIYILFGVLCLFCWVMLMVATDRAAQQQKTPDAAKGMAANAAAFAAQIVSDHENGIIPAEQSASTAQATLAMPQHEGKAPAQDSAAATANPPADFDLPPPPQNSRSQVERDDEAQRIAMTKLLMLEEAVKAKTGVQVIAARSSADSALPHKSFVPQSRQEILNEIARVREQIAARTDDPTSAYQQRLMQIEGMRHPDSASFLSRPVADGNAGAQFDSNSGDRWQLNTQMQAPRTPYELRAGFVIPATLISGINSELPGQIVAQVSQNVSDTATGSHLLIPQGSRLIGSYSNDVGYGQKRIWIAWQRIVFPDGKALDIGSMPGADAAGFAGFYDQVNNHYLRILGSAFLMSGVTAGVALSQDNSNSRDSTSQRASDALSEALGQQLGQVMIEMIRKNMSVAPTLEIRPGYRFNVIVTKDMTFSKPYRSFDY